MKHPREPDSDDSENHSDSLSGQESPEDDDYEGAQSGEKSTISSGIKFRLMHSLTDLPASMSFASSGLCPIEANPAIYIFNLGGIGLPLSERDAQLISSISHQAPYGNGSETIVNTAVRQTKELNADQFELKNPMWKQALDAVVRRAMEELGVSGDVKAILYKMLLYGKGSMFKEHRDSVKEPGMFGTLVICLPSKHEGGEVYVTHGDKTKILNTAESSEFNYTYLCWYADAKHKITEVTSGYRYVLTYNLINVSPAKPVTLPEEYGTKMSELRNALSFWKGSYNKNSSGCPTVVAYILDHLYTKQTLSLSGLKGYDRVRCECLFRLSENLGFLCFLAKIELQIYGECEDECGDEDWADLYWRARNNEEPAIHCITKIDQEYLELQHIVELDGTKLVDRVPFQESQIVQEETFLDCDPDEEDFSGPTGNEGVSATHFYHRCAAILMPADYRINFLFQSYKTSANEILRWINHLIDACDASHIDSSAYTDLRKACGLIAKEAEHQSSQGNFYRVDPRTPSVDYLLTLAMRGGLHLNDECLCKRALSAITEQFPQPTTIQVLEKFGFSRMKPQLENSILHFNTISQSLDALIGTCDEYKILYGDDSQALIDILEWSKIHGRDLCIRKSMSSGQDASSVVSFGVKFGESYFISELTPAIIQSQTSEVQRRKRWAYCAISEFLTKIVQNWKDDRLTHKTAQHIFGAVLQEFISHMHLVDENLSRTRISSSYSYTTLDSKDVIGILRHCVALDLEPQTDQLLDKLEKLAGEEDPAPVFQRFFLPFAKDVNGAFIDKASSALAQNVQNKSNVLAGKLIDLYPTLCVGPKPLPPLDWRRARAGCGSVGCLDCLDLDSFLVDPVQEKTEISVKSEERLGHLKRQIAVVHRDDWNRKKPEHDIDTTTTESTFTLSICKTQAGWENEVSLWEQDRKAAIKIFGQVFDDVDLKKALEARIEELGQVTNGGDDNSVQV